MNTKMTRHVKQHVISAVSLFQPKFHGVTTYLITHFNVTDTFCQFCGNYGINDLESRLKVIWGVLIFAPIKTYHTG